jgi:hypothetical protein
VQVVLARPEDVPGDLVVLPGVRAAQDGRTVTVPAPRWRMPAGPEHLLANAYRQALAAASARHARTLVLPAVLALGPWPLDDVTRVALTVLGSTPTTVVHVTVAAQTPAMLETWAEALARQPTQGRPGAG